MSNLDPFQRWMVKQNLIDIQNGETGVEERVTLLRARGYPHIAEAVEFLATADVVRETVDVYDLDADKVYTYWMMSPRKALVIAYLQVVLNDYNTWDYGPKLESLGPKAQMGPSGKTLGFSVGDRTFSAKLV